MCSDRDMHSGFRKKLGLPPHKSANFIVPKELGGRADPVFATVR